MLTKIKLFDFNRLEFIICDQYAALVRIAFHHILLPLTAHGGQNA